MPFGSARRILASMTELDQVWSRMLTDSAEKADATGREHVAAYLRLRATNDAIRRNGVDWLFDTVIEIAGPAMGGHDPVLVEREEPHSFTRGNSTMTGAVLRIRQGVRCLTVEAGWARLPADGIMQKGALAYARIAHFGMPKHTAEIRLVHGEELPAWLDVSDTAIDSGHLRQHFDIFLGA
ncbi:MAG: hypothetical protein IPI64_00590 [Chloracidobacterium sp.]|nr:hypothetical protein [Chloracidobacterium sp.]